MNLKALSDKNLLSHTLLLAQKERQILVEVLWHLREIDNRKLYSDLKCSSLFDYCVKVLKYSEGQASRRVSATRLLKEVPKISKHIEEGKINLTQLNQAKSFFDEMKIQGPIEKEKIINTMSGKSTRDTEKMLWEMKGDSVPHKVSIVVTKETLEKLTKIQKMKSHKCADMDSLISKMCDEVEKNWDPSLSKRPGRSANPNKRHVSIADKAYVWERDQGKCRKCGGSSRLEYDHITPFAHGGKTEPSNLRLLCRNCNQREGIKFFGQRQSIHFKR